MKRLLLIFAVAFMLLSCNSGDMDNNENSENNKDEQGYLTITYHSEGHTSGEVPVDDNRYPIVATGHTMEEHLAMPYAARDVIIYGRGTLEKENFRFLGWKIIDPNDPEYYYSSSEVDIVYGALPTLPFALTFMDADSRHLEIHAVWYQP